MNDILKEVDGLSPIMPQGSMYIMVKINIDRFSKFSSCLEFTEKLIEEQSVQTFPGFPCFDFPGYFRIVLTVPKSLLMEACDRIKEFCADHIQL